MAVHSTASHSGCLTRPFSVPVSHYQAFSDKTHADDVLQKHITLFGDVIVCMSAPDALDNWLEHTGDLPQVGSSGAAGEPRTLPKYVDPDSEGKSDDPQTATTASEKQALLTAAASRVQAGRIHHERDIYPACVALDEMALIANFTGKPRGAVKHHVEPGVMVAGSSLRGRGKLGDYNTSVGGRTVKITEVKRENHDVKPPPLKRVVSLGAPPEPGAMPSTDLDGWEFVGCHGVLECMMQADGAASESHQGRVLHVTNARFHRFGIHQRREVNGRWVDWFWWDAKLWDLEATSFNAIASLIRKLVVYVMLEFPECTHCAIEPSIHLPKLASVRTDPTAFRELCRAAAEKVIAGMHVFVVLCASPPPPTLTCVCPSLRLSVPLLLQMKTRPFGAVRSTISSSCPVCPLTRSSLF